MKKRILLCIILAIAPIILYAGIFSALYTVEGLKIEDGDIMYPDGNCVVNGVEMERCYTMQLFVGLKYRSWILACLSGSQTGITAIRYFAVPGYWIIDHALCGRTFYYIDESGGLIKA